MLHSLMERSLMEDAQIGIVLILFLRISDLTLSNSSPVVQARNTRSQSDFISESGWTDLCVIEDCRSLHINQPGCVDFWIQLRGKVTLHRTHSLNTEPPPVLRGKKKARLRMSLHSFLETKGRRGLKHGCRTYTSDCKHHDRLIK